MEQRDGFPAAALDLGRGPKGPRGLAPDPRSPAGAPHLWEGR